MPLALDAPLVVPELLPLLPAELAVVPAVVAGVDPEAGVALPATVRGVVVPVVFKQVVGPGLHVKTKFVKGFTTYRLTER